MVVRCGLCLTRTQDMNIGHERQRIWILTRRGPKVGYWLLDMDETWTLYIGFEAIQNTPSNSKACFGGQMLTRHFTRPWTGGFNLINYTFVEAGVRWIQSTGWMDDATCLGDGNMIG